MTVDVTVVQAFCVLAQRYMQQMIDYTRKDAHMDKTPVMKRLQIFALILLLMGPGTLAQDDYYINLSRRYQNEADRPCDSIFPPCAGAHVRIQVKTEICYGI